MNLPHALPLRTDAEALGLQRLVIPTSVGEIVVRAGRRTGGPATILLHGAAGSWTTWTPLLAASALAHAPLTDVIALDLPGWGESCGIDRVHSVGDLSDAIVEVARALGYDSWRVVGHSLGGFVALDVAARHPDSTLGVVLVSASGAAVVDAIRRPLRGGLALPGFAGMLLGMRALAAFGAAGRGFVRFLAERGWMPALTAPLFSASVHPSVVAAFADEARPAAFGAAARLAAAYELRTWTGVRCPVRSVRGARDVFAGESDAAAFIALIPEFREVRLAGAGHFAHIERPDAVLDALLREQSTGVARRTANALDGAARS
ncbi:alpha/beta fold hydrolase [Microbacterium pygmaeum]|uniref:Pimeloyl-ACP methyl ester carboxylesterase n=1 Tax=Microbacterium pygmaeum TaxID=370764 RepID=A0A1G8DS09_9MICO|nr:alpha/beta hydrolase [Microbacterium pygmaeum]SDH60463.1 Pimeloyl-ACP methyl ester carboxylesterase [Microbacterium pygmaeum]